MTRNQATNETTAPKVEAAIAARRKSNTTHGAAPKPAAAEPARQTKQALLIDRLQRPQGASIAELVKATGWQNHSVRGAISFALKKKLGLNVTSQRDEKRGRVYRITKSAKASGGRVKKRT